MDIGQLIKHPEMMDKDTLYDLRSLLALYPYYQTARLLMLQNLYLLHAPTFDEELRRAAIYITDRRVIFNLVEAAHYRLRNDKKIETATQTGKEENGSDRTLSLIDQFLESIPKDDTGTDDKKRKPTPVDAAVDYVAYLLETESEEEREAATEAPQMRGQELIDDFIDNQSGKIELQEIPDYIIPDDAGEEKEEEKEPEESYFTETLARIYIKQGRYSKALEIIKRLNLNNPKKNAYFADQIRFLQKLIINNKYKKQ